MTEFLIGDLVCHKSRAPGAHNHAGEVVGFCPGPQWVCVRTFADRRHRIWLKSNVHNVDAETKQGNHAPGETMTAPPPAQDSALS